MQQEKIKKSALLIAAALLALTVFSIFFSGAEKKLRKGDVVK